MRRRVGIDLSGSAVALAHVGGSGGKLQLRGFALIETGGDVDTIAGELREARRAFRLPKHAEVIAWPGDIRPDAVRQAGFIVERVIAPSEALARVAQLHHGVPMPERVSAVVCVHQDSGAVVVVRDGHVLHEASLEWPLGTGPGRGRSELLRRYAFLAELTESLRGAFAAVARRHGAKVTEILTCGSLPDLRSLTMPLADEFDVEVETLDSTTGIELRLKRESAERAQEVMAALRLAIVAGRRWHTPSPGPRLKSGRAAGVVAAAAAAIILAVYLWPRGTPRDASETTVAATRTAQARQARTQPSRRTDRATSPPGAGNVPSRAATEEARARSVPAPKSEASAQPAGRTAQQAQQSSPAAPTTPAAVSTRPMPSPAPSASRPASPSMNARGLETPQAAPSPISTPAAPPPREASRAQGPARPGEAAARQAVELREPAAPPPATAPQQTTAPQQAAVPQQQTASRHTTSSPQPAASAAITVPEGPAQPPVRRARVDPPATQRSLDRLPPFPVPVSSIMWSADRQFAVVEGRILGVGDSIRGARIVEIRADALIVRDASGRLRRAGLGQ
jgi:hypothetical protein